MPALLIILLSGSLLIGNVAGSIQGYVAGKRGDTQTEKVLKVTDDSVTVTVDISAPFVPLR